MFGIFKRNKKKEMIRVNGPTVKEQVEKKYDEKAVENLRAFLFDPIVDPEKQEVKEEPKKEAPSKEDMKQEIAEVVAAVMREANVDPDKVDPKEKEKWQEETVRHLKKTGYIMTDATRLVGTVGNSVAKGIAKAILKGGDLWEKGAYWTADTIDKRLDRLEQDQTELERFLKELKKEHNLE